MKKVTTLLIFGGIIFAASSCKKGECTCNVFGTDISTEYEAEDHEDYKDAKEGCESAGCEWKAKL